MEEEGEGKKKGVRSQAGALCGSPGLCEHRLGKAVSSSSFQWRSTWDGKGGRWHPCREDGPSAVLSRE